MTVSATGDRAVSQVTGRATWQSLIDVFDGRLLGVSARA